MKVGTKHFSWVFFIILAHFVFRSFNLFISLQIEKISKIKFQRLRLWFSNGFRTTKSLIKRRKCVVTLNSLLLFPNVNFYNKPNFSSSKDPWNVFVSGRVSAFFSNSSNNRCCISPFIVLRQIRISQATHQELSTVVIVSRHFCYVQTLKRFSLTKLLKHNNSNHLGELKTGKSACFSVF